MKAFSHSLGSLLNASEAMEKARAVAVAASERHLQVENNSLAGTLASIDERAEEIVGMTGKRVKSERLSTAQAFISDLNTKADTQKERIEAARLEVAKRRRALLEAVTNRRMLERHREKERARWLDDTSRLHLKEMDEIAMQQFSHRKIAAG